MYAARNVTAASDCTWVFRCTLPGILQLLVTALESLIVYHKALKILVVMVATYLPDCRRLRLLLPCSTYEMGWSLGSWHIGWLLVVMVATYLPDCRRLGLLLPCSTYDISWSLRLLAHSYCVTNWQPTSKRGEREGWSCCTAHGW